MYTIYNLQASFGGFKPDPSGVVKALARISGAEARRDIYSPGWRGSAFKFPAKSSSTVSIRGEAERSRPGTRGDYGLPL